MKKGNQLRYLTYRISVVLTYHAGIPEAVVDGETGFLVSEGNFENMATCISELALGQSRRDKMGAQGRKVVEDKFTWEIEKIKLLQVVGLIVIKIFKIILSAQ